MPHSPASKAFFQSWVGRFVPYGTTISLRAARCTIGRIRVPSSQDSWCSTSPSIGSIETRTRQFSHDSRLPSTVKPGPSGWTISSGFMVVRAGPARSMS